MTHPRLIMHIDMNAFFASVEQSVNPKLRGKPIGVIGSGHRTVVTTCSYEARKFGVRTGMTVYEARRRCPSIILVVGNNQRYTHTCTGIVALFQSYTPLVEVYSIDECFMDMTGAAMSMDGLIPVVKQIKKEIYNRFRIKCSAGIAANKLLAKLGSDMQKPDGLTIIREHEKEALLAPMPVDELCGIGSKLASKLFYMGITTCGQLARCDLKRLTDRFGVIGEYLHCMARGEDDSPVVTLDEVPDEKSVGHSMTVDHDVSDIHEMERLLLQLSEQVGRRMRRHHFTGRTVALTIRYTDFTTITRRKTWDEYLHNSFDIYLAARAILHKNKPAHAVRLLGVAVTNLAKDALQLPLFEEDRRRQRMTELMDKVNDKHGEFTLTWARIKERYHHPGVISPAWRPAGARRVEFGDGHNG